MQVTRDRLLREFQPQEAGVQLGTQYGSGYPGGKLSPCTPSAAVSSALDWAASVLGPGWHALHKARPQEPWYELACSPYSMAEESWW